MSADPPAAFAKKDEPVKDAKEAKVEEAKALTEVDMQRQAFEAKPFENVAKLWFTQVQENEK